MKALFIISNGLYTEDEAIISDCLWAVSYLADTDSEELLGSIAAGETLPKLLDCIDETRLPVIFVPAVRTVANIMTTNEKFIIDKAIFEGIIPRFCKIMKNCTSVQRLLSELCWGCSNIFASGPQYVELMLNYNNGEIFERLFDCVNHREYDVSKEAIWAITNAITESEPPLMLKIL